MTKYLLKRLLTGVLSACAATIIVMIMIFSLLDRNLIFAKDSVYSHQTNNAREAYKYRKWREYGYLDYVTYADYVNSLVKNGEVDEETAKTAVKLGRTAEKDSEETQAYIKKFTEYYEGKGYKVVRLNAVLKPADAVLPRAVHLSFLRIVTSPSFLACLNTSGAFSLLIISTRQAALPMPIAD